MSEHPDNQSHAKLSASGSARWLQCPGSVEAEAQFPDTPSPAAEEGTCAHAVAEYCLKNDLNADSQLGEYFGEYPTTQEMVEAVQVYLDYVRNIVGDKEYEIVVGFDKWVPGGFGTADCIVLNTDDGILHVCDFKYGRGVLVDAEENSQLRLYALGALEQYSWLFTPESVLTHIVQPRRDNISTEELAVDDLFYWGEWAKLRAEEADKPDAPRHPSTTACMWCKAAATCPALRDHTQQVIGQAFDEMSNERELPETDHLSDEELRTVQDNAKLVRQFLDAVEGRIESRLRGGGEFSGFKLVEGRSSRSWADEIEAQGVLESLLDDAYEHKLMSPAKAEKALGKDDRKAIQEHIVKKPGRLTLAPESDRRPAAGAVFEDESED